jgi:hypothetical protein
MLFEEPALLEINELEDTDESNNKRRHAVYCAGAFSMLPASAITDLVGRRFRKHHWARLQGMRMRMLMRDSTQLLSIVDGVQASPPLPEGDFRTYGSQQVGD